MRPLEKFGWLYASGSGSEHAAGDLCCIPFVPLIGACSLDANDLLLSNGQNRKLGEINSCCGDVPCGADCGIGRVVEEAEKCPIEFSKT